MTRLITRMDQSFYPKFKTNWDDWLFREQIMARLRPESIVLDLGAGAGIIEQMNFKGHAARICGVDLDPRVVDNPMLDEGKIADAGKIPYGDAIFDLVFSDNVLEHLADPAAVFGEVRRVLKPGGRFLFKTPNKWHYVPTLARLTPHSFHQYVNRLRGRDETDTFPTLYRANCRADIALLAERTGLRLEHLERIEGRPEYLRMTWPTYLVGTAYERLVNASPLLAGLRVLLIGEMSKPAV